MHTTSAKPIGPAQASGGSDRNISRGENARVTGASEAAPERYQVVLSVPPERALKAAAAVAELWGAEWTDLGSGNAQLLLPQEAGLRRGLARCRLRVDAAAEGCEVELLVVEYCLQIHAPLAGAAAMGALGTGVMVLWPFFPALIALLPIGLLMTLGAWFLVGPARAPLQRPASFLGRLVEELETAP
ncbi:MAG: hypothetical protein HYV63_01275 [Candidatus Schekmanbacteria bacterium]|nr:hypothetical protein [Candidatus Schekmanbacteria bacterium]